MASCRHCHHHHVSVSPTRCPCCIAYFLTLALPLALTLALLQTSVKERFSIKASKVVPFMSGAFDVVAALDRKVADGELSSTSAEKLKQLARECQDEIVARRLSARVRTRYKRAAYQHATDNAVRCLAPAVRHANAILDA